MTLMITVAELGAAQYGWWHAAASEGRLPLGAKIGNLSVERSFNV
jgi:hypothetical protein